MRLPAVRSAAGRISAALRRRESELELGGRSWCSRTVKGAAAICVITAIAVADADGAARERPRPCRDREVSRLVRSFVDAFNRGDSRTVGRLVAREPEFRWWSTSAPAARLGKVARDRRGLGAYLANRHADGERWQLTRLKVNGNSRPPRGEPPYGNFEYDLTRQADEFAARSYAGKGGVYCYRHRPDAIIVWSMGARYSGEGQQARDAGQLEHAPDLR